MNILVHTKNLNVVLRVYLTFTTGGKIWKTAGHIDFKTVYMHMDTPENSQQNDF